MIASICKRILSVWIVIFLGNFLLFLQVPKNSASGFLLQSPLCLATSAWRELNKQQNVNSRLNSPQSWQQQQQQHRYSSSRKKPSHVSREQQQQGDSRGSSSSTVLSQKNEQNFTVTFPPYTELQRLNRGEFVASSPFNIIEKSDDGVTEHEFRVLLYPRGGGHGSSRVVGEKKWWQNNQNNDEEGGFGMSYKVMPLFQQKRDSSRKNDKVGVYLQYLPKTDDSTVDATFTLRLKGTQSSGPRFDVEWSAGMRFVSASHQNLRDGLANDFGAHLMQSELLPVFLGVVQDKENDETTTMGGVETTEDSGTLQVQVRLKLHPKQRPTGGGGRISNSPVEELPDGGEDDSITDSVVRGGVGVFPLGDIRTVKERDGATINAYVHDGERVRVGKVVVPVLRRLSERPRMFEKGAYPGVEYRIMRIFDPQNGQEIFTSVPGADYELKPIYPLVSQLERNWPIRINEREIPKLYTAGMYNAISAIGSLFTAIAGLAAAFVLSQLVSLFFIPSHSMDPTLKVGDVLVVEKVTPRVFHQGRNTKIGDVVLFTPSSKLRDIVLSSGGKKISDRDLFVKRIAAGPGDLVSVDKAGSVTVNGERAVGNRDLCDAEPLRLIEKYIQPGEQVVPKDDVFVMGDCSSVSVDSRVWGSLDQKDIVGRPLVRIWPLERFGSVPSLPTAAADDAVASTQGENNE